MPNPEFQNLQQNRMETEQSRLQTVEQEQLDQMTAQQLYLPIEEMEQMGQVEQRGAVLEEVQLIDKVLSGETRVRLASGEVQLRRDKQQMLKLKALRGRHLSSLLLNSRKSSGDSRNMRAVKNSLQNLEAELQLVNLDGMTKADIQRIEAAYRNTIAVFANYLNHHTSYTETGRRRYAIVRRKMEDLLDEMGRLSTAALSMTAEELQALQNGYGVLVCSKLGEAVGIHREDEQEELSEAMRMEEETVVEREDTEGGEGGTLPPEEQAVRTQAVALSEEDQAAIEELDQHTKDIVRLLLLAETPAAQVKREGKDGADPAVYVYHILRNMPKNRETVQYLHGGFTGLKAFRSGASLISLHQSKDGALALTIGDRTLRIPHRGMAVIDRIEKDILEHQKEVSKEAYDKTFSWLTAPGPLKAGEQIRRHTLLLRILKQETGIDAKEFHNVPTEFLRELVLQVRNGQITKEGMAAFLGRLDQEKWDRINGQGTLELLHYREEQKKAHKLENKVVFPMQQQAEADEQNGWTEEERAMKDLTADFIFSRETWQTDELEPGARLFELLRKNQAVILRYVRQNPEILDELDSRLEDVGRPAAQCMLRSAKLVFRSISEWERITGERLSETDILNEVSLDNLPEAKKRELMEKLAQIDREIDEMLQEKSREIEEEFAQQVDQIFGAGERTENQEQQPVQEQQSTEEDSRKRLERMMEEGTRSETGYGQFVKNVLRKYFTSVNTKDQRCMLSWALREAKQKEVLNENYSEEEKLRFAANYMSGMLKGAGPLLQKVLQGMPLQMMPGEIQGALADMKSNLLPIPKEVVEAELLAMVKRSKGRISKIEVVKALGAASVGQTFLCRIYESGEAQPKDVVVKLLRPDVRNRMQREKQFMLEAAGEVNEGMRKTYEGQLAMIEREADLTLEADNVEKGKIYDKERKNKPLDKDVKSMKVSELVAPTTNALVLEKAGGDTVDRYLKNVREKRQSLLSGCQRTDDQGNLINDHEAIFLAKKELRKMLKELETRQKFLITLSEKWVEEGVFKSGFYHGDLHAGNIMFDENGATLIDFGNATQLTRKQTEEITRMVAAAAAGTMEQFRKSFHVLMEAEGEEELNYQKKREEFGNRLEEIFALGTAKDTGLRIAVALVKAQELGLKLPSAIFNFSQCQMRLENAVNAVNEEIENLRSILRDMNEKQEIRNDADVLENCIKELGMCSPKVVEGEPQLLSKLLKDMRLAMRDDMPDDLVELLETDEPQFEEAFAEELRNDPQLKDNVRNYKREKDALYHQNTGETLADRQKARNEHVYKFRAYLHGLRPEQHQKAVPSGSLNFIKRQWSDAINLVLEAQGQKARIQMKKMFEADPGFWRQEAGEYFDLIVNGGIEGIRGDMQRRIAFRQKMLYAQMKYLKQAAEELESGSRRIEVQYYNKGAGYSDFFEAMADIISDNWSQTMWRLGLWGWWHRNDINM